ncbi:O-antigen polymerase [Fonticella tunisiensis]|uniref:O-antigen polysaccharide polymerase Wzy-like protein n=1 Tax=Fonticella tunisiensis TaxID=1096341 RepID=A0A4R7K6B9_9CLOT|nr:O-antigen polymerase [Fonticella tunisiensis]TDT46082.1 O-antigen polysaccharide polymerase Wzy-like protein [Fonticella tunisiensis]
MLKRKTSIYFTIKGLLVGVFIVLNLFILFINLNRFSETTSSFFLSYVMLNTLLVVILFNKKFSPLLCTILVFFYIFMWLTPIFQIKQGVFPNTLLVNASDVNRTNIYISLFLVSIIIGYKIPITKGNIKENIISNKIVNIAFIFSLTVTVIFGNVIFKRLVQSNVGLDVESSTRLIIDKFIFMIPFAYTVLVLTKGKELKHKMHFLFASLMVLIYYNPLVQKRNSLGPILLMIFFYLIRKRINNFTYIALNLLILLFVFPLAKIITHNPSLVLDNLSSLKSSIQNISLIREYTGLDYDAYSNIIATNNYVNLFGFQYGKQLMGDFLFFIPRKIWELKPLNTGMLIGRYLMYNNGMWFDNLSNPIVSEAFIDFGIIGIVVYGLIIGRLANFIEISIRDNFSFIVALFVSQHFIFLLRGDLMNGIAYLVGPLLAIVIFKAINKYFYKHEIYYQILNTHKIQTK